MELLFVLLLIGIIIWLWSSYNRMVLLREACRAAASDVETQLARRYDLYIKATSVLSSGSDFERGVFQQVTELRTRKDMGIEQKVAELGRLFAVAEANPTVQSVELFAKMQSAVFETETLIQSAREIYNSQAKSYNSIIKQLPMNIAALILGFKEMSYFTHTE